MGVVGSRMSGQSIPVGRGLAIQTLPPSSTTPPFAPSLVHIGGRGRLAAPLGFSVHARVETQGSSLLRKGIACMVSMTPSSYGEGTSPLRGLPQASGVWGHFWGHITQWTLGGPVFL
jgi:hypothetical protein